MLARAASRQHLWRGRPLESVETVVSLIGNTSTKTGLPIKAVLDRHLDEKAITVSDHQLASLNIKPHRFHGEWNYTVHSSPS
jgi:hypothetical protein